MRILFVSAPLVGHLFPMVPLARALRDAGHDVLLAAGGEAAGARPAALPVADIAPGFDLNRTARRLLPRHPLIARAELAGTAGTRGVALLFGAVNDQLAGGAIRLADEWAPDLVVHEPLAVAGAIAAAHRGIPAVLHGNSLFDDAELVRVIAAAMRRRPDPLPPAAATLLVAPPSVVGSHPGWPMRPVPYGGEGEPPDELRKPAERPRILVSRSTVPGPGGGDPMSAVIAAAAQVEAEIVLVRPEAKATRGRALPPNVRVVGWIPLARALPDCAGIVHHGGVGTILAAMAAGVPQLVTPGPGDRRYNAETVAARGAGLAVPARRITADRLRQLVTDPALAEAAGQVAAEIAGMPPPEELVDALVELAR